MRNRIMITLSGELGRRSIELEQALREQVNPNFDLRKFATAIVAKEVNRLYIEGTEAAERAAKGEADVQSESTSAPE